MTIWKEKSTKTLEKKFSRTRDMAKVLQLKTQEEIGAEASSFCFAWRFPGVNIGKSAWRNEVGIAEGMRTRTGRLGS